MSEERSPMSRRQFLRITATAGAVGLLSAVGCAPSTESGTQPITVPTETSEVPSEEIVFDHQGVRVWADTQTKLPIRWQDGSGKSGSFDKDLLLSKKEAALKDSDIRLATSQRVDVPRSGSVLTIESPAENTKDTELPSDVLSEEKLRTYGVEVIPGNTVELFLREDAFAPGGILEEFREGDKKLQIVLVDEAVISPLSLDDPQYDAISHFRETHFGENSQYKRFNSPGGMRAYLIEQGTAGIDSSRGFDRVAKEKFAALVNSFTDEEVVKWGLIPFVSGYTLPPTDDRSDGKYLVLLACGERKIRVSTLDVIVDPQGTFSYAVSETAGPDIGLPDYIGLDQSQTRPKGQDFALNERGFYGPRNPVFTLIHELTHVERHLANPDPDYWSDDEKGVDQGAYKAILKSEQSGTQIVLKRKDQQGYIFV